jgi:hypothetical protein
MEKDKEKELLQSGSNTNEKVLSSGAGAISGSTGSGATGGGAKGSSFTNVQEYLTANAGDNASKMAGDMTGKVQTTIDSATQAGTKAKEGIATQAAANSVKYSAPDVSKDRYAPLKSAESTNALKTAAAATYKGPKVEDRASAFADSDVTAGRATDNLNLLQTEQGTGTVLKDVYKGDNYTKGMNFLDSQVLSGSDSAKKVIGDFREKQKNFPSVYKQLGLDADSAINTAIADTGAARTAAQGTLASLAGNANNAISSAEKLARKGNEDFTTSYNEVKNKLRSGSAAGGIDAATVAYAKKLGIDPASLVSSKGNLAAGNFLDAETSAMLPSLSSFLQEVAPGQYQLPKSLTKGQSGLAVDTSRAGSIKDMGTGLDNLDADVAAAQNQRDSHFGMAQ